MTRLLASLKHIEFGDDFISDLLVSLAAVLHLLNMPAAPASSKGASLETNLKGAKPQPTEKGVGVTSKTDSKDKEEGAKGLLQSAKKSPPSEKPKMDEKKGASATGPPSSILKSAAGFGTGKAAVKLVAGLLQVPEETFKTFLESKMGAATFAFALYQIILGVLLNQSSFPKKNQSERAAVIYLFFNYSGFETVGIRSSGYFQLTVNYAAEKLQELFLDATFTRAKLREAKNEYGVMRLLWKNLSDLGILHI